MSCTVSSPLPDVFAFPPAVYAVGQEYQIFIVVKSETLM